jgi:hypothetical protein
MLHFFYMQMAAMRLLACGLNKDTTNLHAELFQRGDDEQLEASVLRIAITICADEQVAREFSGICPSHQLAQIASQRPLSLRPLYDQLADRLPMLSSSYCPIQCNDVTHMRRSSDHPSFSHSPALLGSTMVPRMPALRSTAGNKLVGNPMIAAPVNRDGSLQSMPANHQHPALSQLPVHLANVSSPLLAPVLPSHLLSDLESYNTPKLPMQARYLSASMSLSQGFCKGLSPAASSCTGPAVLRHSLAVSPSPVSSSKASTGFSMPHPSTSMLYSVPAPVHATKVRHFTIEIMILR